jgi:hypothetical protein
MLEYSGVIVLSVLLQFTTFDYIFGIFKLFSKKSNIANGYLKMGSIAGSRDPAIRYTAGVIKSRKLKKDRQHNDT